MNKRTLFLILVPLVIGVSLFLFTFVNNTQRLVPEQSWWSDNADLMTNANDSIIHFRYFKKNILEHWKDVSVSDFIENEQYQITAFFKGPVVGFDMVKEKYFIIWIPTDPYEWATAISFISNNTLQINSANTGFSFNINLDTHILNKLY